MPEEKPKRKAKTKTLSSRQRALLCAQAAFDAKAEDIKVLGVGQISSFADYFVITSGRSTRHVQAVADKVQEDIRKFGSRALGVEGEREARWVLIDWGDVIVHVFHLEERSFYELEKLWADAKKVTFPRKVK